MTEHEEEKALYKGSGYRRFSRVCNVGEDGSGKEKISRQMAK